MELNTFTEGRATSKDSPTSKTVVAVLDVPITVADVADFQLGPAMRRGALNLNGADAVGGVVVLARNKLERPFPCRSNEHSRTYHAPDTSPCPHHGADTQRC